MRKMSSFPAARVGFSDRGLLRPGMKANITVFDPGAVRDNATFEQPTNTQRGSSMCSSTVRPFMRME